MSVNGPSLDLSEDSTPLLRSARSDKSPRMGEERATPYSGPGDQPHSHDRLARVAALGWPAVETEELGGWLLQASAGFTGRANSVVPCGEPGVALGAALDRVVAFYARRGLPALIQVIVDTPLEAALRDRGWRVRASGKSPHTTVDVQVAPLAIMLGATDLAATSIKITSEADQAWLRMYGREPTPFASAAALHVLGSPERVAFARIHADGDHTGPAERTGGADLAGVGRGVVTGPWIGIAAVEVAPHWRRRGLGRALMHRLGEWGREQGASWVYLQVGSDNTPALRMYERLGFGTDHRYRYYTPT
jgi:N-acetylglutamate synthase